MADLPPGQVLTKVWPVYDALGAPEPPTKTQEQTIKVWGEVDNELLLNWEALMKLPKVKEIQDFHCVTRWSRVGDEWEGVSLNAILDMAKPKGKFIMFHCYEGYSANVPMDYINEHCMLAYNFNGKPLEPIHGGPMRARVPTLYGWKSAKWVNEIEVMKEDRPGFWEKRGYNMRGDYTKEERYWEGINFVSKVSAILSGRKENEEKKQ